MTNQGFNQAVIASYWGTLRSSAESYARQMGQRCIQEFADLILSEAHKFCGQNPPATDAELNARQAQSMALTAKIGAIAHAGGMARVQPGVIAELFQAAKGFSDRVPLSDAVYVESSALTAEVSTICHAETMRRLTDR